MDNKNLYESSNSASENTSEKVETGAEAQPIFASPMNEDAGVKAQADSQWQSAASGNAQNNQYFGNAQNTYAGSQQNSNAGTQQTSYAGMQQTSYAGSQQNTYAGTQQTSYTGAQQNTYAGSQQTSYTGAQQGSYAGFQQTPYTGSSQGSTYYGTAQNGTFYGNAQSGTYAGAQKNAYGFTNAQEQASQTAETVATGKVKKAKKQKKEKGEKKGIGFVPTLIISGCTGLVFGAAAALGLFAINNSTGIFTKNTTQTVSTADAGSTASSTVSSSSSSNGVLTVTSGTTVITGSTDVSTVAEAVMPSMVSIVKEYEYTDTTSTYFWGGYSQNQSYTAEASGSGIIIGETDTEYLIVSNNHVVEDPISLEVTFVDGTTASAYIKGCDEDKDVAVIAVLKSDLDSSTKSAIQIAVIGDSSALKLGEQVVAIGNALGYGQSVTTGIVSALDREIETEDGTTNVFIQTDAAINPGNSGGALLNMAGEVVGINSNKIGGTAIEGMGYAIPISSVTDIINELMEHTTKIPLADDEVGYIGISLQEVTESLSQRFSMPVGIYIVEVTDGGAAQAAGLQAGDIITKFDGEDIDSYDDLSNTLQYYAAGTTVTVTYERPENGTYTEYTVSLTLGKKP